jgi:hypothetical protein
MSSNQNAWDREKFEKEIAYKRESLVDMAKLQNDANYKLAQLQAEANKELGQTLVAGFGDVVTKVVQALTPIFAPNAAGPAPSSASTVASAATATPSLDPEYLAFLEWKKRQATAGTVSLVGQNSFLVPCSSTHY